MSVRPLLVSVCPLTLLLICGISCGLLPNTNKSPRCDVENDVVKLKEDVAGNMECCTQNTERLEDNTEQMKQIKTDFQRLEGNVNDLRAELEKSKTDALHGQVLSLQQENKELKKTVHVLKRQNQIDCQALQELDPSLSNGVQRIFPAAGDYQRAVNVYCDMDAGGWTVLLKRYNGVVDFNLNWEEMKKLVGDLTGEFWLGLEDIHLLTSSGHYGLLVEMFHGSEKKVAYYKSLKIGSEVMKYKFGITGYDQSKSNVTGDAVAQNGQRGSFFSTKDRENDRDATRSCVHLAQAPGWFGHCYLANPLGPYTYTPGQMRSGNHQVMAWYTYARKWIALSGITLKVRRRAL